jgi:hypothetical protein
MFSIVTIENTPLRLHLSTQVPFHLFLLLDIFQEDIMNRLISVVFTSVLILSFSVVMGCRSGNTDTPNAQSKGGNPSPSISATSQSPSNTSKPTTSPAPSVSQSGGDLWGDVPVYAGATQVQQASSQQPGGKTESLKFIEWRFFETTADAASVASFYQTQLPAKGWTKASWIDMGPLAQGTYQKNNESRLCLIQIITDSGKTTISVMSGSK